MKIQVVNEEQIQPSGNNEILLRITPKEGQKLRVLRDQDYLNEPGEIQETQLISTYGLPGRDVSKPWILVVMDEAANGATLIEKEALNLQTGSPCQVPEVPDLQEEKGETKAADKKNTTFDQVKEKVMKIIDTMDDGELDLDSSPWLSDAGVERDSLSEAINAEFGIALDLEDVRVGDVIAKTFALVRKKEDYLSHLNVTSKYEEEYKETLAKVELIINAVTGLQHSVIGYDWYLKGENLNLGSTSLRNLSGALKKEFGVFIPVRECKDMTVYQLANSISSHMRNAEVDKTDEGDYSKNFNEIFTLVKEVIRLNLGIDKNTIELDSNINDDLGADSLDVEGIAAALEKEFEVCKLQIDNETMQGKTVRQIVSYISSNSNPNHWSWPSGLTF